MVEDDLVLGCGHPMARPVAVDADCHLKKDLEPLMIRKMSRHFGILKKWRISISIQCENGHQKQKRIFKIKNIFENRTNLHVVF
jgi:hypothetical protein